MAKEFKVGESPDGYFWATFNTETQRYTVFKKPYDEKHRLEPYTWTYYSFREVRPYLQ